MNDYGFDYMNYITTIPSSMNYNQPQKTNTNYTMHTNNMPQNMSNMASHMTSHIMPNTQSTSMTKNSKNQQTLSPTEGWLKGNLFSNQYEPYRNYKPANLDPQNEQEALLYQVMQYKFALIELDLYLDTHPNDSEMINLYNQYLNIEKQMSDKYESMYGPLTLDSDYLNKNTWVWKNSPWPWEGI